MHNMSTPVRLVLNMTVNLEPEVYVQSYSKVKRVRVKDVSPPGFQKNTLGTKSRKTHGLL